MGMEKLIIYSKCCSQGWKSARLLVKAVEEKVGVKLRIEYLSWASSQSSFEARGITLGEATADPVFEWGRLWISTASKALNKQSVERLCELVRQEAQAYE